MSSHHKKYNNKQKNQRNQEDKEEIRTRKEVEEKEDQKIIKYKCGIWMTNTNYNF